MGEEKHPMLRRSLGVWGKDIALLVIGAGLAIAASVAWEAFKRPTLRFFLAGAVLRTETSAGATLTQRLSEVRDRYNDCIVLRFQYSAISRDVLLTTDSIIYVDKLVFTNRGRSPTTNVRLALSMGSRYTTELLASPNIRLDTISEHMMGPIKFITVEIDRVPGQQTATLTALAERAVADPRDYQDFRATFLGSQELAGQQITLDTIGFWTVLRGEPQIAGVVQGLPIRSLELRPPANNMNMQLDDIHYRTVSADSLCEPFTLGEGVPFPDTLHPDF